MPINFVYKIAKLSRCTNIVFGLLPTKAFCLQKPFIGFLQIIVHIIIYKLDFTILASFYKNILEFTS